LKIKYLRVDISCLHLITGNLDSAKRCAYLLEDNDIYKEMIALYEKRSRIVHNGLTNIESSKTDRLLDLVLQCLFRILYLRNQIDIHDKEQRINFFNEQKRPQSD
jgi:Apea-like HEPN